jgi:hypothetical protein
MPLPIVWPTAQLHTCYYTLANLISGRIIDFAHRCLHDYLGFIHIVFLYFSYVIGICHTPDEILDHGLARDATSTQ